MGVKWELPVVMPDEETSTFPRKELAHPHSLGHRGEDKKWPPSPSVVE
jgi:hypothetical protein